MSKSPLSGSCIILTSLCAPNVISASSFTIFRMPLLNVSVDSPSSVFAVSEPVISLLFALLLIVTPPGANDKLPEPSVFINSLALPSLEGYTIFDKVV